GRASRRRRDASSAGRGRARSGRGVPVRGRLLLAGARRAADGPPDPRLGGNRRDLSGGIVIRIGFLASHEWRLEIPFVVAIGFLLVFMGLSVANFVSVAQVHGSLGVEATASVGYLGLASNGTL